MHIIAVASQKGGSGKTTLAGHLAVQAESVGAGPVALIDTDPQGSLSEWWNARATETPSFARTTTETLKEDVERLRALGIKLVVIDTPPAIEATIADMIGLSLGRRSERPNSLPPDLPRLTAVRASTRAHATAVAARA